MLGWFTSSLSAVVSVAFPVVASYKALLSNDATLLRPWLMYWVVLGIGTSAETLLWPILQFVPLYGTIRLAFLAWLVLPSTQGAVTLYNDQIEPWLRTHDHAIDEGLSSVYNFVRQMGADGVARLSGSDGAAPGRNGPSSTSRSTADSLLSRFRLPVPADYDLGQMIAGWRGANSREQLTEQRSLLLGLLASLDKTSNEQDRDGYDVVDPATVPPALPRSSPSAQDGPKASAKKGWFW